MFVERGVFGTLRLFSSALRSDNWLCPRISRLLDDVTQSPLPHALTCCTFWWAHRSVAAPFPLVDPTQDFVQLVQTGNTRMPVSPYCTLVF